MLAARRARRRSRRASTASAPSATATRAAASSGCAWSSPTRPKAAARAETVPASPVKAPTTARRTVPTCAATAAARPSRTSSRARSTARRRAATASARRASRRERACAESDATATVEIRVVARTALAGRRVEVALGEARRPGIDGAASTEEGLVAEVEGLATAIRRLRGEFAAGDARRGAAASVIVRIGATLADEADDDCLQTGQDFGDARAVRSAAQAGLGVGREKSGFARAGTAILLAHGAAGRWWRRSPAP